MSAFEIDEDAGQPWVENELEVCWMTLGRDDVCYIGPVFVVGYGFD